MLNEVKDLSVTWRVKTKIQQTVFLICFGLWKFPRNQTGEPALNKTAFLLMGADRTESQHDSADALSSQSTPGAVHFLLQEHFGVECLALCIYITSTRLHDQRSQSQALGECGSSISAPRSIRIPHACAEVTCGRRFWSSSCTGISSRPSGFASGRGGWSGRQMHDCSEDMRRVSHLPNQKEKSCQCTLKRYHVARYC